MQGSSKRDKINLAERFRTTTLEEIVANPQKYGAPTWEQFSKNPEQYRQAPDWMLAAIERGSANLGGHVQKHVYKIFGNTVKSLERAQRIALEHGYDLATMDVKPEVIPTGGGKCNIEVTFKPKLEIISR